MYFVGYKRCQIHHNLYSLLFLEIQEGDQFIQATLVGHFYQVFKSGSSYHKKETSIENIWLRTTFEINEARLLLPDV